MRWAGGSVALGNKGQVEQLALGCACPWARWDSVMGFLGKDCLIAETEPALQRSRKAQRSGNERRAQGADHRNPRSWPA